MYNFKKNKIHHVAAVSCSLQQVICYSTRRVLDEQFSTGTRQAM